MTMGSNKDFRCQPALAHLLQVATRQAMHTSQVQGPHRIQTVFSGDSHWYGPTTKYLPVDPEEDSFISSEGDISLLQEGYHEKEHSVLFKDLVLRSGYAQCSEKQILLGKIFEQLTDEERVFLNAAYLGDVGIVRQSLEESAESSLSVNCVDYMGRNALHLAIDSEKLDIIEILLDNLSFNCIEEALLHAISKGATKIVKIIIEHPNFMAGEDRLRRMGGGEAFFRTEEKSQFPPDITPLILAAHYNNHEIIQMFLSRNHTIEKPHPISCKCSDCVTKQNYDSLKRSRSRLNAYRALASPAYMALSSPDPIMTTFELRQEMMKLAEVEKEFKSEYLGMVEQCMNFACELMDLCRGTQEVEAVLSESGEAAERDPLARLKMAIRYEEKKFVAHPNCQQHMTSIWYGSEMGFLQSLNGLMQLIYLFLFIPVIPFLCVSYVFVPSGKIGAIMRCPVTKFITHTTSHMCFLVLLAAATFRITESDVTLTDTSELHDARYASLEIEEKVQSLLKETLRPASTLITHVQICIVFWILGLLWIECKQIYNSGARSYITDYYNTMDFGVLSMYLSSYVLRFFTEYKVSEADRFFNGTFMARKYLMQENYTLFDLHIARIKESRNSPHHYFMEASRFQWEPYDPEIVSDALFAIANVISFARTTWLMPAFEVLGPLQISLGRMIGDITRFMVLFTLVLFAFMVGLHNLYWYYGSQKVKMDLNGTLVSVHAAKAFQGLRQTFTSLFWSMFGQVSISEIAVKHPQPDGSVSRLPGGEPILQTAKSGLGSHEVRHCLALDCDRTKIYCTEGGAPGEDATNAVYSDETNALTESSTSLVETVGMYLFGIYHVVIIIVLINMLIAMMSHSFEDIQTDCDVEWKFARTKLWLNYMDEGSTLPVPFNMLPTPKSFFYGWQSAKELFCKADNILHYGKGRKQTFLKQRRETVCKTLELKPDETSYTDIMHRLVKRYLFKLERAKDEKENVKDGHGNLRGEEVEIWDPTAEGEPPPPLPDTPSRIPYATPPIAEEEEEPPPERKLGTRGSFKGKRKNTSRQHPRRTSAGSVPLATTLAIPQLDAIQRSQKLLDVRLQHLQANSRENNRMMDDVEFIRRLMTENQKALCNVVQALANIQGEIVNLAQCLRPTPRTQPQTQTVKTSQTAAIATPATSPTAVMPNAGINQHQPSIHHHYHQSQPPVANAVSPGNRSNAVGGQTPAGSSSSSSAKKRGSGPDEDESKV
ncbi:short transient receptor potential channel 3-like isoform X2 [Pomacea canaliculata]|uniref:short transient receptor potential channel 3-like isoform X2 n=1 Tax=Pomacea canaliculata TaxID=400727 RepID=UPI000D73BC3C|nr:short transient receptor potential channel 3-like isoform X2 [Pomacea canaliculata]